MASAIIVGALTGLTFLLVFLLGNNLPIAVIAALLNAGVVIGIQRARKKAAPELPPAPDPARRRAQLELDLREFDRFLRSTLSSLDATSGVAESLEQVRRSASVMLTALREGDADAEGLYGFIRVYLPNIIKVIQTYTSTREAAPDASFSEEFARFVGEVAQVFDKKAKGIYTGDIVDSRAEMKALRTMFQSEGLSGSDFDLE